LHRLDEARSEIQRAIKCMEGFGHTSEPWKTWAILAQIEEDAGNFNAAAEAKHRALACYVAYRRDGGENHNAAGRLSLAVTESLVAGDAASAASLLQQLAGDSDLRADAHPFIRALKAIVAGGRDRALADDPELDYDEAAEIILLIE